ncbi:MAG TPA: glycogen phosphorylase, partial [Telluria sp.]
MNPTDFNQDNVAILKRSITDKLIYTVGKQPAAAQPKDWLRATALAVRDRLVDRALATEQAAQGEDVKHVYYLSIEFLIGRAYTNALLALDIHDDVAQALAELGVDSAALPDLEHDAALG